MYLSRLFLTFFLLVSLSLTMSLAVHAEIIEGKDYTVLSSPQSTQSGDKIEVLEFFWYGCPHCNNLHPHIKAWLKNIPDDVSFYYVPAIFRTNWIPAAKTFYAMEAIGATEILHDKAYDALHRDKIDLNKEPILFDWVAKQGVDREKFIEAYNSFTVENQVARSTQIFRQYKLTGVPALVVGGKYLTSGSMGGTPQGTIKILQKLVDKARQEKSAN